MATVYSFKKWDVKTDQYTISKRKAVIKTICRVKGTPILETAEEVADSALDGDGFYGPRRVAEQ